MVKRIITALMAATLAGGLLVPQAQARPGVGLGSQIDGFLGMHVRDSHMDNRFNSTHISSRLQHENRDEGGVDGKICEREDSDCGLYGCRYLWQSQVHCY
jgi:hypothetical protein